MPPWKNSPPLKRFEERYIPEPNSGCWLWLGLLREDGYGLLSVRGKHKRAHVWAYEHFKSKVPKHLCVLHNCDVRCCVNPEHLRVGTKKQNTQDAIDRRRFPQGIEHHVTTLTENQIQAIRKDARKQRIIAAEYGVCQMTISNIKARKTWKYLP